MTASVDTRALETQVKRMYEQVATEPGAGTALTGPSGHVIGVDFTPAHGRLAVADIVSDRPLPDRDASASYGVHSVSVLATKPRR